MNQTRKLLAAMAVLIFCFGLAIPTALADSSGTSVGTATVTSVAPTISMTNCNLYDSTEANVKNNTSLDSSNIEYHLNFTVGTGNQMKAVKNVTIIAWDNRGQAVTDADSQRYHYTWTYVNLTDTWACPLAAGYITTGSCVDYNPASLGETSFTMKLAFKLSKVANYSNGGTFDGWQFNITAYDNATPTNQGTFGSGTGGRVQFGVASYIAISITDVTHTWSAAPGTSDNVVSAGGDGQVDFTALTNRIWKAQVDGSQNLTKGSDIIELGNVTHYGTDVVGSSVPMTFSYVDVTGITAQAAPATEASPTAVGVYLWLDIPTGTPAGDYVYTLNIQIAAG